MMLREFVYRETSEFEVIRTAPGREMRREILADVIGKQAKLKKGVKIRNQHRISERKFSIAQRRDW
jgi:hypothetical protein